MDIEKFRLAPWCMIPDHFLSGIGLVMVQHAFMDAKLQGVISHLSGMDFNSGASILSKVSSTSTRVEILQNLARTKIADLNTMCKMLVIAEVIIDLCQQRNILAHSLPYAYGPSADELTYFKEVNKTIPQIRVQPPYLATVSSLSKLARELVLTATWLGMFLPMWIIDGTDPREGRCECHPHWKDDAEFPWPERLEQKLKKESRKPQNLDRVK